MTEPQWRYHTPERDGHAPDDWVEGLDVEVLYTARHHWEPAIAPLWFSDVQYRYRPLQTVEPSFDTLKDQCLALPQDQREALIEAMQKPTLLPCPFCGGEASDAGHSKYNRPLPDTTWEDGSPVTEAFFVNCMTCGAVTRGDAIVRGYQTKAEAITAWNRRVS